MKPQIMPARSIGYYILEDDYNNKTYPKCDLKISYQIDKNESDSIYMVFNHSSFAYWFADPLLASGGSYEKEKDKPNPKLSSHRVKISANEFNKLATYLGFKNLNYNIAKKSGKRFVNISNPFGYINKTIDDMCKLEIKNNPNLIPMQLFEHLLINHVDTYYFIKGQTKLITPQLIKETVEQQFNVSLTIQKTLTELYSETLKDNSQLSTQKIYDLMVITYHSKTCLADGGKSEVEINLDNLQEIIDLKTDYMETPTKRDRLNLVRRRNHGNHVNKTLDDIYKFETRHYKTLGSKDLCYHLIEHYLGKTCKIQDQCGKKTEITLPRLKKLMLDKMHSTISVRHNRVKQIQTDHLNNLIEVILENNNPATTSQQQTLKLLLKSGLDQKAIKFTYKNLTANLSKVNGARVLALIITHCKTEITLPQRHLVKIAKVLAGANGLASIDKLNNSKLRDDQKKIVAIHYMKEKISQATSAQEVITLTNGFKNAPNNNYYHYPKGYQFSLNPTISNDVTVSHEWSKMRKFAKVKLLQFVQEKQYSTDQHKSISNFLGKQRRQFQGSSETRCKETFTFFVVGNETEAKSRLSDDTSEITSWFKNYP